MARRKRRRRKGTRLRSVKLFLLLGILIIGIPALLVKTCHIPFLSPSDVPMINLWRPDINRMVTISLEEYIEGVVAAEMPLTFDIEALKAQAVVSRTYAYRRIVNNQRVPEHPDAHFTPDYRSGQAWVSWEELRERWGLVTFLLNRRLISQAVDQTTGIVAIYDNQPILAVYHSTSGGRTENSEHYWSEKLPYLRSVSDPYGDHSPFAYTTATFSRSQFRDLMEVDDVSSIRVVERFPSGRVKTFEVADQWFSGREVRQRLNLRSTWFSFAENEDQIEFSVWGYGHGVGMSQYGADGMGKAGYDYQQILQYYYQGISLQQLY